METKVAVKTGKHMISFASLKRFHRRKWKVKLYILSAIIGAIVGIFILFPLNEFIFFYDQEQYASSLSSYVFEQLSNSLKGSIPQKTVLYSIAGSLLGVLSTGIYSLLSRRQQYIQLLSEELTKDIKVLISQGEGSMVEFKSSFRWDIKQSKKNQAVAFVVLKTIAGFMNSNGGTLLIGVTDEGKIIGLEKDYQSLRKRNRDGFEQAVITAVSINLGTDLCQYIKIVFHSIDGLDICRVIVMQSSRPVYIEHSGYQKFYARTGSGTREMNIKEAVEFISARWPK